jgi:hypothetical protein
MADDFEFHSARAPDLVGARLAARALGFAKFVCTNTSPKQAKFFPMLKILPLFISVATAMPITGPA